MESEKRGDASSSSTDAVLVNLASRAFCERQHALSKISRSEREDEEDEDESLYDAFRDAPIVEFIVDECIPFANVVELDTLVNMSMISDREVDPPLASEPVVALCARSTTRRLRFEDLYRRFLCSLKSWRRKRIITLRGVRKRGKENERIRKRSATNV